VLLYLLARRWFSPAQSAAAGFIYALTPGAIGFVSLTMSETLFTFLCTGSLAVLAWAPLFPERSRTTAVAFGALVAAAAYVRGQGLLLPLLAPGWLRHHGWRDGRARRYALLAFAAVAVLSLPWAVRNTIQFEQVSFLSTNAGMNFWLGHREGADGGPDYHAQLAFAQQFDHLPRVKQEPAWSREGFREGWKYALTHPLDEAWLSLRKVYLLYRDDNDALLWNEQNGATPIFSAGQRDRLTLLFDGYYYLLLALALPALVAGLAVRADWAVFAAGVVAYWTAVHVIFYAEPRLHVPLLPVLALLAVATLFGVLRMLTIRRERPVIERSGRNE
jgi:hypothetical protein